MTILERFLLKNYLKVLLLCVVSFIAILLVSRLQEIARFATLGASLSTVFLFILYQIPYILPFAVPVSCLISAMILFQRLSHTHELTALRASGISLFKILNPLLLAASFLSLITFYTTSELATRSHLATRKMVYNLSSVNPLILIQNSKIAKMQGAFVQMSPVHSGQAVKDVIVALSGKRLNLYLAKKVEMKGSNLIAKNATLISTAPANPVDHLLIENQKSMNAGAGEFAKLLKNKGWKIATDHLKFSLLKIRYQSLKDEIAKEKDEQKKGKLQNSLEKCQSELARRVSVALSALTFTLLGSAFGMEISRNRTKRGLVFTLALASFSLITFFVAKGLHHLFWIALSLFFLPHLLIVIFSFLGLRRVHRGVE